MCKSKCIGIVLVMWCETLSSERLSGAKAPAVALFLDRAGVEEAFVLLLQYLYVSQETPMQRIIY